MTNRLEGIDGLGFFLYRSTAAPTLTGRDLRDILTVARARNDAGDLTGHLHHEDGLFFQWLEGPAAALRPVVASIRRDPRHHDLTVLDEGALDRRRFQDWRMRFSDRDAISLMDWLAGTRISTVDPAAYAAGIGAFLRTVDP